MYYLLLVVETDQTTFKVRYSSVFKIVWALKIAAVEAVEKKELGFKFKRMGKYSINKRNTGYFD